MPTCKLNEIIHVMWLEKFQACNQLSVKVKHVCNYVHVT